MREEIDKFLSAEAFVPFRLTLSSGQVYPVRNPNLAMLGNDVLYIMHANSDLHSVLRLVQIASIDTMT